jgi:hypothetical protein
MRRSLWTGVHPIFLLTPPRAGLTYGAIFNGDAFVFTKIDRSAPSADGTSFPMYMSEPIHVSLIRAVRRSVT